MPRRGKDWKRRSTSASKRATESVALPAAALLEGGSAHLPIYQKQLWNETAA